MGVKTAQLVEGKGRLAGARIVRDGYQVMLISDGGTVIRTAVDGIKRSGRATQGVIVMRLREGEQVSSLAPVIGADEEPDVGLAEEPDAEVLGPEGATAEPGHEPDADHTAPTD
jgi:DNA gyrase subunit A